MNRRKFFSSIATAAAAIAFGRVKIPKKPPLPPPKLSAFWLQTSRAERRVSPEYVALTEKLIDEAKIRSFMFGDPIPDNLRKFIPVIEDSSPIEFREWTVGVTPKSIQDAVNTKVPPILPFLEV